MEKTSKPCSDRRISCEVSRPERAGRAPYNFVPLHSGNWPAIEEPPGHVRFVAGLHSGIIEIELEAKTDFYIRGMWALPEFVAAKGERPVQKEPFQVYGKLRLPGSSLRGLFRSMVEIISASPIDFINDTQLFFRTVASVPDPANTKSFEPQAQTYKDRILAKSSGAQGPELKVEAGYLYGSFDRWYIKPAGRDANGRQYYRYRTEEKWVRRRVRFDVEKQYARIHANGREEGWLVCSGAIFGKNKQWVVRDVDRKANEITIPYGDKTKTDADDVKEAYADDVKAYKEGGVTKEIRKNGFDYNDQTRGVPCFYVTWRDRQRDRVTFGHTPYFRLPYKNRPPDCIPDLNTRKGREKEWDMARAIFGWVPRRDEQGEARRGRVIVEDGVLVSAPEQAVRPKIEKTVLGQPKPTTYQHYLVQPSDQTAKIVHWDGTCNEECVPVIRGHKLYWHRPGAEIRPPDEGKSESVSTEFRRASRGAVFRARLRYDNLRLEEVGALLAAIELPPGCVHHLGMGKPLGLGSFAVTLKTITPVDRQARYRAFLNESGALNTGVAENPDLATKARKAFALWFTKNSDSMDELWKTPRLQELKALLTFSGDQQGEGWLNRTRYLEFGRLPDGNYNEYLQVPGQQRPRLEKRRPLPPASQVLKSKNVPTDARPKFQERGSSGRR